MTLRKRLFWLFAPLLVLALGFAYALSQSLILSRFDRQDANLLEAEAERLQNLLEQNLRRNLDLVQSYAQWDTSYEFMHGQHPDYLSRNADPDALAEMNFDFMVFLDLQGQVYAEQWQPPSLADMFALDGRRPANQSVLRRDILAQAKTLIEATEEDLYGALIEVQGVPLILAMGSIKDNQSTLPKAGTLLAGHFLDGERIETLQGQISGTLRLLSADDSVPGWVRLASPGAFNLNRVELSPRQLLDEDRQQVLLRFSNSLNQPQMIFELTRDRRLYHEGRKAIVIFLAQATGVGLFALLLIYLGLEFAILRRVSRMHLDIAAIGPDSSQQRLKDRGSDELGRLAQEVNRMLERLEQSEARDREILDAIEDGYFELSPEGNLLAVNRALCSLLGYSAEAMLGQSYERLLSPGDVERARQDFAQALANGEQIHFTAPLRRGDGSLGHYETRFSLIRDGQGHFAGFRGILRDVSEQVAYQNQLLDMAYRDSLTGLGNRKAFTEQLRSTLDKAQREHGALALIYLDLDRFKEVNDRYGHDVGDALLQSIAERLRGAVRQPDRVYRLGGDEFTLVLPGSGSAAAEKLAARLLSELQGAAQIGELHIDFVTPSIGIALYPDHAQNPQALIKAADSAMYEAKRERNRVCLYHPGLLSSSTQSG
ncbi:sensor domain-containing diguanylate cyclase [Pseudomonas sp. BMS12]|uniref:sensor domain-containing diguanylate cyclase n=1 Tax=Pseudomonas sp. BMS12 TaxID=1796033 RepID=UPI00083AA22E|nr:diguanylate cyclase [Pseudomonas sp. BMS12]